MDKHAMRILQLMLGLLLVLQLVLSLLALYERKKISSLQQTVARLEQQNIENETLLRDLTRRSIAALERRSDYQGIDEDSERDIIAEASGQQSDSPDEVVDSNVDGITSGKQDASDKRLLRQRILDRLTRFGFSAYQSERISELEIAAIEQYELISEKSDVGARQEAFTFLQKTKELFREELGEFGYTAYLEAKNLPTGVTVQRVSGNSKAASIGLKTGDQIERYAGTRVYDIFELNQLVQSSTAPDSPKSQVVVYTRNGVSYSSEVAPGMLGLHSRPVRPRDFFNAFNN